MSDPSRSSRARASQAAPDNAAPGRPALSAATEKKLRTRNNIVSAARRAFAAEGFEAARVSDIVARIKMSQGTFYYHFPDKKSILVEMIESFFGEIRTLTATWAQSVDTSEEAGARFARDIAVLFHENRDLVQIIIKEHHSPDADVRRLIHDFYAFLYSHTQMGLELGIRLGSVRPMDTRVAAIALIGMIEKVVAEQAHGKQPIDIGHIVTEIANLQNYGIRPRPDGKSAPAIEITVHGRV